MRIVHTTPELRQALAGAARTAFVPTMGNLLTEYGITSSMSRKGVSVASRPSCLSATR